LELKKTLFLIKKTGFIGASLCTMVFSFFFSALLAQFNWNICPAEMLHVWPNPPPITCTPNPVFIPKFYELPLLGPTLLYPIQWHGLAYGLFASFVAPFGGFFASAIKRAYHKKDFESFMPGHGGMMDRMDCQLVMMTFNSFYYSYFIAPRAMSMDRLLLVISELSMENKARLWNEVSSLERVFFCLLIYEILFVLFISLADNSDSALRDLYRRRVR
jgi:phosphatidate cytidylyltransferase